MIDTRTPTMMLFNQEPSLVSQFQNAITDLHMCGEDAAANTNGTRS